ncbi:rhodanese-like domain-containing protein [Vibrio scophthalmi]|uniref:rhodanese-like domain-containing protein n=1 Tax=Vibrio scophthalmi TaxID=45658 RepID=UPI002284B443|nr:rhodanese-like domain-containing protein [Vibrio scophthalmi]MCY9803853.1 rhodanese-like domain-containing protein [Vibrio scophthalmi]
MNKALIVLIAILNLASASALASPRAEQGWQWIEQGALVVDVRTPQEFQAGHLDDAINYPLSDLAQHFANIDKQQAIVVYCRSGARSGRAYDYLISQGFTQVHNAGGFEEMQQSR